MSCDWIRRCCSELPRTSFDAAENRKILIKNPQQSRNSKTEVSRDIFSLFPSHFLHSSIFRSDKSRRQLLLFDQRLAVSAPSPRTPYGANYLILLAIATVS